MKGLAKTVLKAGVTALLLFLLYRKVDGRDFVSALSGLNGAPVVPFFAILFANTVLSALRWRLLLRSDGVDIPLGKLVASYWISSFFNFFLPSNIGGDVYRIADIGRRSGSAVGSLASVFADRLCGFITLSLAGFLFPLAGLRLLPPESRPLLALPLLVFLGFLALALLLWQQRFLRACVRVLPGAARARVEKVLDSFLASVAAYAGRPRVLFAAFAISATFQFLVFVAIWLACRALLLPVSLAECCVFAPFVCLLEAVPLTINGIGLRDSGYALFFSAVGLAGRGADPATSAATLSLCYMGLTLAYSCVGGLLFLRRMFSSGAARRSAAAVLAVSALLLPAVSQAARRDLPGFGKDAVYRRSPMPVPPELSRATERAERLALTSAPATGPDSAAAESEWKVALAEDDPFPQFLAIARVMVLARERHPEPASFADMAAGAMEGIAMRLDPNCAFLDEAAAAEADNDLDGEFDGIGVTLLPEDGVLRIDRVFPDSPALRAGLLVDDAIVAVGGVPVADVEPDDAIDAMSSDAEQVLLCRRAGGGPPFEVRVRRRRIHFSSISARCLLEPGVGYIRVDEFREDSPVDFIRALESLESAAAGNGGGLRSLVIDLRDNPGGVLDAAVEMAGWFLPDGAIVAETRGRIPDQDDSTIRTGGDEVRPGLRIAILMDGGSASAAELFAAALRDNGRASLVGSRSYGKASVQQQFELSERSGAIFNLTVAHYYTPTGADLHGRGLEPDVRAWQNDVETAAALRARYVQAHPETASEATRARLSATPDKTLDAALALLRARDAGARAAAPEDPGATGGGGEVEDGAK